MFFLLCLWRRETASSGGTMFDGVDLTGAILKDADLRGVDLTRVQGLTRAQLDEAMTDEHTRLPDYL